MTTVSRAARSRTRSRSRAPRRGGARRPPLAHQLALEGHEARDGENPIPALALLGEEPWDLVLTDLRMPTMDGLAFLHRIRETRPDTAAMVITGHATAQ